MPEYDPSRALELLRLAVDNQAAQFRDSQDDAIRHVVEGRGRLLVVQKTGWGKSLVYFIATKMLRDAAMGPAILVSPLLALMRNQIDAAERMGLAAVTINSDNPDQWDDVEAAVANDEVDILLVAPERLANQRFRNQVLARLGSRVSLLVVDEAHCISDWGHDFRPHYRLIERFTRNMPPNLRLLATTATANDRVMDDLREVLGPDLAVSRGDLNRPSLFLQTMRLPSQAERMAWLAEKVPEMSGSGIIYALTKRDANQLSEWLQSRGIEVEAYTGDSGARRPELERALLGNDLKALVATTALGMGYDKPDLAFVIHYQTPGSVVAYYQQVGRAGRALDAAYGILLSGREEGDINEFFIRSAFPTREEVRQVLAELENEPDGLSVPRLLARLNISKGRIEKALTLLSLEAPAPVVKEGPKWQLTAARLDPAFWDRADRLTELRRQEHKQMQEYVDLPGGHMEFLIGALDGDPAGVTAPDLPHLTKDVDAATIEAAVRFLQRTNRPIQQRKRWPVEGLPAYGLNGGIPANRQCEEGRALCVWGDAGWGNLVCKGKYEDGEFEDQLVEACVEMIHEWEPDPWPEWVACVPSLRHPDLVPDLARRLADELELPFHEILVKTDDRPPQKTMENSSQQARNVDGSLAIGQESIPEGPVLLVDDMVDSRWTLTIAGWILRKHGSGKVFPLALALAGAQE